MKKIISLVLIMLLTSFALAYDVPENEEYYKTQIQNQRFLYSKSGMFNAIQKGNTEVLELFLNAGFSPDSTFMGNSALKFALYKKQSEAFDILLKHGAKPEDLLADAVGRKSSNAVKALIMHNADVNAVQYGITPLNYALRTKQPVVVEMLLKAGAKPDEKTYKLVNKSKDAYIKDLFAEYKGKDEK